MSDEYQFSAETVEKLSEEVASLKAQLAEYKKDAARMDFLALYGSFGCDTVSGLPGGNGQKRLAATRSNVDAVIFK